VLTGSKAVDPLALGMWLGWKQPQGAGVTLPQEGRSSLGWALLTRRTWYCLVPQPQEGPIILNVSPAHITSASSFIFLL
jgi:hypothetical protein